MWIALNALAHAWFIWFLALLVIGMTITIKWLEKNGRI